MNERGKSDLVSAWVDKLVLPTYPVYLPEPNPMFFEKRNVQGSAGNIYPVPFTDRLSSEKHEQAWEVVYLENDFLQMILLPALGGRVFAGLDKTNGYDFFYRHRVIKPALIGLYGPWISGGVEFNWPQHHRPSTFMPVEFTIEEGVDGSKTVWMSEHEPTNRMKGMVGICLYPGKAFVEMKVQLYNRTPFAQTFLWWANAAVHIHDDYQVIFPPDVHYAVFHTKQFVTSYPIAKGKYFQGAEFGDGVDVSWQKNIFNATSFFAAESKYAFFGGYDHRKNAGVVNVANRFVSPGKKFFTWANGPFGLQWQKNLTDYDDPYLELMAGVFTDNQPDFSWLQPFETKTFSQYWIPIQQIGPAKNANLQAAVNLEVKDNKAALGVLATESFLDVIVSLSSPEQVYFQQKVDLEPGKAFLREVELPAGTDPARLLLKVNHPEGYEIIRYIPEGSGDGSMPEPYQPPPTPEETKTNEELFLVGLHLHQYRHSILEPEPYWQEALRRDPEDIRCNNALGLSFLRHGDFVKAEEHFRKAVKRSTWRNLNAYDCEPSYNLGLTLRYQGRDQEAYEAFYRAVWDAAQQTAGYYALAELDCRHGRYEQALDHAGRSLQTNTNHLKAGNLIAAIMRRLGLLLEAEDYAVETMMLDPLDFWSHNELVLVHREAGKVRKARQALKELTRIMRDDPQNYLDLAFDYLLAGLFHEAFDVLQRLAKSRKPVYPLILYTMGYAASQMGEDPAPYYRKASRQPPDYCFPWRLDEMIVLRHALQTNPKDGKVSYYLGNLLYDKRHSEEAISLWEAAVKVHPKFSTAWRNLALAAYNIQRDGRKALRLYTKAFEVNRADPRVLSELDQIRLRLFVKPEERLAALEAALEVVMLRDDLIVQLMGLYLRKGQPVKALEILKNRHFHPWEGGEGQVSGSWNGAYLMLGRQALDAGQFKQALEYFVQSIQFPVSLGEASFGEFEPAARFYSGLAKIGLDDHQGARVEFEKVRSLRASDWGSNRYFRALAFEKLGEVDGAHKELSELLESGRREVEEPFVQNYFYPQNPSVTFVDNPQEAKKVYGYLLTGLARLGLGQRAEAKTAFAKVLEADPSSIEAWEEYRRL